VFDRSARLARELKKNRRPPLCDWCKSDARRTREPVRASDADRRFWLSRFSDQEIIDIAFAMFGAGNFDAVREWRRRLGRAGPRSTEGASPDAPAQFMPSLRVSRSPESYETGDWVTVTGIRG
jgi:hypothetical protein